MGYKDETRSYPGGAYGKRRHVKMMFMTTIMTMISAQPQSQCTAFNYVPGTADCLSESPFLVHLILTTAS